MICAKTIFHMPNTLQKAIGQGEQADIFQKVMMLTGKPYRDVPGRKTSQITIDDKRYFIKQHFGVGWKEIVKNLTSFKKPILGAMTEVQAIDAVSAVGIATTPLVAYGQRGCNPATLESFVITEDLGDIISLEDLCVDWQDNPPDQRLKRKLIIAVAKLANTLHCNGINHRDFYLCHLCLDKTQLANVENVNLYLIDLHRVQIHSKTSITGNMKDIAALYFSSMDIGLTGRDYVRFKHYYQQTETFWQQVEARAQNLYAKFHSEKFQKKLAAERTKLESK